MSNPCTLVSCGQPAPHFHPTDTGTPAITNRSWPAFPVETRTERLERRTEVLHEAVKDRHAVAHRGALDECPDLICRALTDLHTETRS